MVLTSWLKRMVHVLINWTKLIVGYCVLSWVKVRSVGNQETKGVWDLKVSFRTWLQDIHRDTHVVACESTLVTWTQDFRTKFFFNVAWAMVLPRDLDIFSPLPSGQILGDKDLFVRTTPWLATDEISDELNQPRYSGKPSSETVGLSEFWRLTTTPFRLWWT